MVVLVLAALAGAVLALVIGVSGGHTGWVLASVALSAVTLLSALVGLSRPRRRIVMVPEGEPDIADGSVRVWVVDSWPRYHRENCSILTGQRQDGAEPVEIPLAQAVEDGFRRCPICEPPR